MPTVFPTSSPTPSSWAEFGTCSKASDQGHGAVGTARGSLDRRLTDHDGGPFGRDVVQVVQVFQAPALVPQPTVVHVAFGGMLVVEGKGIHAQGNHFAFLHEVFDRIDVKSRLTVLAVCVQTLVFGFAIS